VWLSSPSPSSWPPSPAGRPWAPPTQCWSLTFGRFFGGMLAKQGPTNLFGGITVMLGHAGEKARDGRLSGENGEIRGIDGKGKKKRKIPLSLTDHRGPLAFRLHTPPAARFGVGAGCEILINFAFGAP
jgi:hypothetical protein